MIVAGTALMTWEKYSFAQAQDFEMIDQRYRGLQTMELIPVTINDIQDCWQNPEIAI